VIGSWRCGVSPAILVEGAIVAALAAMLSSCSAGSPSTDAPSASLGPQIVTVTRHDIQSVVVLNGSIIQDADVPVRSTVAGSISKVLVGAGAAVVADQAIAVVTLADGSEATLTSAVDGSVVSVNVITHQNVSVGSDVADVAPHHFQAIATVDPSLLYRFYGGSPTAVRVQIDGGPGPFECPFVSLGTTTGASAGGSGPTASLPVQLACAIPPSVHIFSGIPCLIAATTGFAKNVLTVPLTAVEGSAQAGYVTLVGHNGAKTTVAISLGISDGNDVQVLSGLNQGDRILDTPPNLLAPTGAASGGPG